MQMSTRQQLAFGLALVLLLLAVVFIYWPGLSGVFLLDDTNNLLTMNRQGGVYSWNTFLPYVFGNHSGLLGRPLAMLSFLLDDQAFPGDVAKFRYTNLMIHCLCGVVLLVFCRRFLRALGQDELSATMLALLVSAWWLLAPLNISTTLYIIQRMTQLSMLFVLLGLCSYLQGRSYLLNGDRRAWYYLLLAFPLMGVLASLSKENGVLIIAYALVCELTLRAKEPASGDRRLNLLLGLPLLLGLAALLFSWEGLMSRYQYREFTLFERLLTESRILWDYLLKAVFPLGGHFGLVHDDFALSRGFLNPVSSLLAVLAHLLLAGVAWWQRRRWPLLFFGAFWFYAGHLLESTLIPLELYYEHRNYLPVAGVMLAIVASLWGLAQYRLQARWLVGALILLAALSSQRLIPAWGDPLWQTQLWAAQHPGSIRAQTDLVGSLLEQGEYRKAQRYLLTLRESWPGAVHLDLLVLKQQCLGNFDSKLGLEDVVAKLSVAKYSGNLPGAARGLMQAYRQGSCDALDAETMLVLLDGLAGLPMSKSFFNSDIWYWQSEISGNGGDLNGAMAALDRAFYYVKNTVYRYRQAALLDSAGLTDEALPYIRKAIVLERRKPVREQRNLQLYERYQAYLKNKAVVNNKQEQSASGPL